MSAPEPVVRAVMEALGCEVEAEWFAEVPGVTYCREHEAPVGGRGCPVAIRSADAAFAASLEWAAETFDATMDHPKNAGMSDGQYDDMMQASIALRRWARADR